MYTAIRTITDRFSLRDLIRHHTPQNGLNYDLQSIRDAITNPRTVALMESGQLYGYFGHGQRASHYSQTGEMLLDPARTASVNGKEVQPASRTIGIELVGETVIHSQEVLNTQAGRIVDAMDKSQGGGWSWAGIGKKMSNGASKMLSFAGVDFVLQPNYIGRNRQSSTEMMLLESVQESRSGDPYLFQRSNRDEFLIMEDGGHNWSVYHHEQQPRQHAGFTGAGRVPKFY